MVRWHLIDSGIDTEKIVQIKIYLLLQLDTVGGELDTLEEGYQ